MSSVHELAALPTSVPLRTLGEVATLRKDKVDPATVSPTTTYVSLEHIEAGGTRRMLGFGEAREVKSTKSKFEKGDVLYGKLRPYLNKVWVADRAGICSTDVLVLSPVDGVRAEYLALFLSQPAVVAQAHAQSSGDLPRVGFDFLAELEIPIPLEGVQGSACEAAHVLASSANAASEKIDRAALLLASATRSALRHACDGSLTAGWREPGVTRRVQKRLSEEHPTKPVPKVRRGVPTEVPKSEFVEQVPLPEGWEWRSVGDLLHAGALGDVKDGNHGSNHPKAAEFGDVGLPFITAAHVRGGVVTADEAPRVDGAVLSRLRVGFAEPGDVILTHKGTVGRVAIAREPCVLSPQTTYYRCDSAGLDADFLALFFESPLFQGQLQVVMSQTTRDFVPIREQYRLFVAAPQIEEQRAVVQRFAPTRVALATAQARIQRVRSIGRAVSASAASATFERLRG